MNIAPRRIAPTDSPGTKNQLLILAGTTWGLAYLVLVPTLYRLALLLFDRFWGPARVHAPVEGEPALAIQKWIGGLLLAFVAGLALPLTAQIRSRYRPSVRQYCVATVLLALLSLGASFLLRALS